MEKSIACAGSVALDTTTTPTGKVADALGGAASFFSVAASFFCPVHLVSIVGGDFPKSHWKLFEDRGIDLTGVQVVAGGKTFRYESEFTNDFNQRKTISTQLNVLEEFDPKVPKSAAGASHAYLATMPPAKQEAFLGQLKKQELSFLDTIEFFIDTDRQSLDKVIGMVDGVVLNESEARKITGENSLLKAGKKISAMGPKIVVVKKGEHGSLLFFDSKVYPFPAFPLDDIVDPTGAGDAFAGGLMGCIAKEGITRSSVNAGALRKAVAYGNVMGSFAVEEFSLGRLAKLKNSEIDARLDEYRHMLDHL
jgi:sugar/nucleoside kinase (ribokinase family)